MPRLSLHVTILALFLVIVAPLSAIIILTNYQLARDSAVDTAASLVQEVNRTVSAEVAQLFQPAANLALLLPLAPAVTEGTPAPDHPAIALLRGAVQRTPNMASIYVGYGDGS